MCLIWLYLDSFCLADVYEDTYERVKGLGCDTECVGGGRIKHDPASRTVKIYGYSQVSIVSASDTRL